jgi:hypothetical protein
MSTTILANNPTITYAPPGVWSSNSDGTMSTSSDGATAEFGFNGVSVQIFGSVRAGGHQPPPVTSSSYSLDGEPPFNVSLHPSAVNYSFYESPLNLEKGNHSLMITSLSTKGKFILASIVFIPNGSEPNPVLSSSLVDPGPPSTFPPTLPPSSSASPVSGLPSESKINVGGVVGGVMAALVTLAILAAYFIFFRGRRRNKKATTHRVVTRELSLLIFTVKLNCNFHFFSFHS